MKRFNTLLTIALGAALAASAEVNDYKLDVQDFVELTVVDGVNVEYHCNPELAGTAVFSCEPEMASHLMFANHADKLTIQTDATETPIEGVPTVIVYSSNLRRCENSGDSLLVVNLGQHVDKFKIKQIGNGATEVHQLDAEMLDGSVTTGRGAIRVDGTAPKVSFSNVGSGPIDASALSAEQIKCLIFGTGDIKCTPSEKLSIIGAGSGSVYYAGQPTKVSNRSIGVKLQPQLEASDMASSKYYTHK